MRWFEVRLVGHPCKPDVVLPVLRRQLELGALAESAGRAGYRMRAVQVERVGR